MGQRERKIDSGTKTEREKDGRYEGEIFFIFKENFYLRSFTFKESSDITLVLQTFEKKQINQKVRKN